MYHHTPLAQLVEHLTFNQDGMGSIPIGRTYAVGSSIGRAPGCGPGGWRFKSVPSAHGILAQLVEPQTENLCVPGSIPGGSTTDKKNREELHRHLEFLRFFYIIPLFSALPAIASRRRITCTDVKSSGTGGNRTHGALLHELISSQPPYDRLDTVPYAVN